MRKSLAVFKENIRLTRELGSVFDYLVRRVGGPMSFDDILRSQVVYAVSAFDKLIHDVVRVGLVEAFMGKRVRTSRYLVEKMPLSVISAINAARVPPKEIVFEQHMAAQLKHVTYQDPDNVSDGLSYIWNERHKWEKIATAMGIDVRAAKTELRLIITRRNFIVHEADMDFQTGLRRRITKPDADRAIEFLESCGGNIVELVV